MIYISNTMFPLRIDRKSKEHIQFEVSLKSQNSLSKLISYEIIFPEGLAMEKGQKNTQIYKLGEMKADETRIFKYKLMPTSYLGEGSIQIIVRAYEHLGSYDQLEQTTEKIITIRVV
ncbi:MAG: hypothetical protein WCF78_03590 [archaeon]